MRYKLISRGVALAASLLLLVSAHVVRAESESPDDMKSFEQLSGEWWQWAASLPSSVNPLVTESANCIAGQHGDVWFLNGVFGKSGTVARTCTVPEGVPLYFPLINGVNVNAPNVCGQTAADISVKDLRAQIAPGIDAASNLAVEIDGKPYSGFRRVRSQVFYLALPGDNIFDSLCGGPGSVPAGIDSPAVDDGFYALVKGLKAGVHTLHFHGEQPGSLQDVTYTLHVVRISGVAGASRDR